MLSGLPKLFDKNFVIGFFLPALVAIFAGAWIFPGLTVLDPVRSLGASEKILSDLTYITLIVWAIAILLMTANYTFYRILEGYVFPISRMRPLLWWHRWRFRQLKARYDRLWDDWQTAINSDRSFPDDKKRDVERLKQGLLTNFPSSEMDVMPTKFGNRIRSFEMYPREVYGADAITVWLRLASVIPKDFMELLDGARAQVDCFVNFFYLALLFALVSLTIAASDANWHQMPDWGAFGPVGHHHVIVAVGAFVFAGFSYYWAANSTTAWGDLVKSAFDCYLPALIKQLGFMVPPTEAGRRKFWTEFSALITYQRPMPGRWPVLGDMVSDNSEAGKREVPKAAEPGQDRVSAEVTDNLDVIGPRSDHLPVGLRVREPIKDGESQADTTPPDRLRRCAAERAEADLLHGDRSRRVEE
jgi:hypothetical protein